MRPVRYSSASRWPAEHRLAFNSPPFTPHATQSPFPLYITVLPLAVILGVSALREAVEDYGRHQSDRAANVAPVTRVRRGVLETVATCELRVGDIVCVGADSDVPADIILLATSSPDASCVVSSGVPGLGPCPPAPQALAVFVYVPAPSRPSVSCSPPTPPPLLPD